MSADSLGGLSDLCMISRLFDGSWKCYTHDVGAPRCALAARSPAPTCDCGAPAATSCVGCLQAEYQAAHPSCASCCPLAAPTLEEREAEDEMKELQRLSVKHGFRLVRVDFGLPPVVTSKPLLTDTNAADRCVHGTYPSALCEHCSRARPLEDPEEKTDG